MGHHVHHLLHGLFHQTNTITTKNWAPKNKDIEIGDSTMIRIQQDEMLYKLNKKHNQNLLEWVLVGQV